MGPPGACRSPDFVADRHAFDAAQEARLHALEGAGQLDLVDALDELAEQLAQLEARQARAQAEVLADAEAQVRVRIAVDAEAVRILEHLFVAVR